jgi:hypothetical protein
VHFLATVVSVAQPFLQILTHVSVNKENLVRLNIMNETRLDMI